MVDDYDDYDNDDVIWLFVPLILFIVIIGVLIILFN